MRRWYSYGRYTTTHYLLTDNLGRFVYNTLLHLVLQWTLYLISPQPFTNDSSSPPTYYLTSLPIYLTLLSPKYHSYVHAPIPYPLCFFVCFFTYPVTSRFVLVTNMILTVLLRIFFGFSTCSPTSTALHRLAYNTPTWTCVCDLSLPPSSSHPHPDLDSMVYVLYMVISLELL